MNDVVLDTLHFLYAIFGDPLFILASVLSVIGLGSLIHWWVTERKRKQLMKGKK